MSNSFDVIIIGTGHAGYQMAQELRRVDQTKSLAMVTVDDGAFYSKPAISTALSKKQSAQTLVSKSAEQMAQQLDAHILTHTQVHAINSQEKSISTSQGEYQYGDLILATGAKPREIPTLTIDHKHCHNINNLVDYGNFRKALQPGDTIAIVGTGLVGVEFANDLIGSGFQVHLIGRDQHLIKSLLPQPVGDAIGTTLESHGVIWHKHTQVQQVRQKAERELEIKLDNGTSINANIVIAALGLIANTELAESAGIDCDAGIITDRMLQTSQPHIYALGDGAVVDGLKLQYIMPLGLCAKALAQTLTGNPTEVVYPAMPVIVKTTLLPTVVAPPMQTPAEWQITQDGVNVKAVAVDKDQQILGFAVCGSFVRERFPLGKQLQPWLAKRH